MMMDFEEFPKMARWSREVIVTEKIDGTNAQIMVDEDGTVTAASRSRIITPDADNFGFAAWVRDNADDLRTLGSGRHFGEWWGSGIQRRYGLAEKRFSLFNVSRWKDERPACCHVVPELFRGNMDDFDADDAIKMLAYGGSHAAPGFLDPEGVVIYHVAAGVGFKKTIKKDGQPKSAS